MNGPELQYLAGVADLARLDFEAAAITLESKAGKLTACYAGAYARGTRRIEADTPDFSISISAPRFKTMATMFAEDDEIKLAPSEDQLRIVSHVSNASLQRWGEESDFPTFDRNRVEFAARLPASSLIAEIEAAQEFVSDSMLRAAFTGILLTFGEKLAITASDGFGAIYESQVPCTVKGHGSIIVPANDFLLGARLIATGDAVIVKPRKEEAVIIYNSAALFRSSLVAAKWPEVPAMHLPRSKTRIQVGAAQIRNLVASSKSLESGPDIEVRPYKSHVLFSAQSEAGAFTTAVKGKLTTPLRYDAATLAKVIKLGPVLDFYVPGAADEPTQVESEHRRAWLITRI